MNLKSLTTTNFDSAAFAGCCLIAHPLRKPGHWRQGIHGLKHDPTQLMDIVVQDGGRARVAIDLEQLIQCDGGCGTREAMLAPNGMIKLTTVNVRCGGLVVRLRGSGSEPVWDSRVLEPGEYFACMPLRPERYGVTNLLSDARTQLRVSYPDPGRTAQGHRLASSPLQLKVGQRITPVDPCIDPGQLLVFTIEAQAHPAVRLEEPNDGPPVMTVLQSSPGGAPSAAGGYLRRSLRSEARTETGGGASASAVFHPSFTRTMQKLR